MSESKREYDMFRTNQGDIIPLANAVNGNGDWGNAYARSPIYCPECGNARLKFSKRTSNHMEYLAAITASGYPPHLETCSHNHPLAPKRDTVVYYRECSHNQAMNKINACINLLKHHNFIQELDADNNHPGLPSLTVRIRRQGSEVTHRLKTRSFYSIYNLSDSDLGYPTVFYGKVLLSTETKTKNSSKENESSQTFNIIKVRSIYNHNKVLKTIYFDNHVLIVDPNREYLFSMLGVPELSNGFISIWFYNRNYDLYRIEDPD